MTKIGIITIHKIINHGSVLQAYALQKYLSSLGYDVEIIDYLFPNAFQLSQPRNIEPDIYLTKKELILKYLFAVPILRQRIGIKRFVKKYLNLSRFVFNDPDSLKKSGFDYDVYVSGSDQIWSSFHCKGDMSFLLSFAPDDARKIAYASSFGKAVIEDKYKADYIHYLSRYHSLSVREKSGAELVQQLIGVRPSVVLDPTLLLNNEQWDEVAASKRIIKRKYIFCYFLNYSFNAHPYVERIADEIQRQTGYELVWGVRPPKRFINHRTKFCIGASIEEFLALIRDAELVLTTSFHGTAFSINYGTPVFSIVDDKRTDDNRQINILRLLGMEKNILSIHDEIPTYVNAIYDNTIVQENLQLLREESMKYLAEALND